MMISTKYNCHVHIYCRLCLSSCALGIKSKCNVCVRSCYSEIYRHIEEVIEYMKKTANSVIQGVAIVGTPLMGKTVFLGYVFFENEKKL